MDDEDWQEVLELLRAELEEAGLSEIDVMGGVERIEEGIPGFTARDSVFDILKAFERYAALMDTRTRASAFEEIRSFLVDGSYVDRALVSIDAEIAAQRRVPQEVDLSEMADGREIRDSLFTLIEQLRES